MLLSVPLLRMKPYWIPGFKWIIHILQVYYLEKDNVTMREWVWPVQRCWLPRWSQFLCPCVCHIWCPLSCISPPTHPHHSHCCHAHCCHPGSRNICNTDCFNMSEEQRKIVKCYCQARLLLVSAQISKIQLSMSSLNLETKGA